MTRSSEYALRALIFLAGQRDQWPIPGREIARRSGIPARYLQKILGDLTRRGVLSSTPGRTGGFRLHRPSRRISIRDVLTPFERFQAEQCPCGSRAGSDGCPCRAHRKWKRVIEAERRFFRETTLEDFTEPVRSHGPRSRQRTALRGDAAFRAGPRRQ